MHKMLGFLTISRVKKFGKEYRILTKPIMFISFKLICDVLLQDFEGRVEGE
jgi:hypothetical protein